MKLSTFNHMLIHSVSESIKYFLCNTPLFLQGDLKTMQEIECD